jgi:hypothetical protein
MSTLAADLSLSAPEDEYPHPIRPEIPLWSENYAFVGYDPAGELGLFAHYGRAPHNPDLWRCVTAIMERDGGLVVSKSAGFPADPQQPGTGAQHCECDQPFKRWTLRHSGLAQRATRSQASRSLISGGATVAVDYAITFDDLHPIWDITDWMREQSWGHAHIEQGGTFRGTVTIDGQSTTFDGTGFRDHTLGPRNFASLNRTCWAHAEFPSGRVFCALRVWSPDDRVVMNQGFTWADNQLTLIEPGEMPTIHTPDGAPHNFDVGIPGHQISGQVLHSIAFMLDEPNDLLLGADLTRPSTKVIVEAPCRYTWDGEVGHGWLERSRRIDQL